MATPANKGAAVTLLIPATATLADGSTVTVDTAYPFEVGTDLRPMMPNRLPFSSAACCRQDTVKISCKPKAAAFPLSIRVPGWASNATIDGKPVQAGTFAKRTCATSSPNLFTLDLAPEIVVETWAGDRHGGVATNEAYSVVRGPLLFSLPIGHNFTTYGRHFGSGDAASNDYYLQPTSAWNYALNLSASALTFEAGAPYAEGAAPFNRTGPLSIKAEAWPVAGWGMERNSAAPPPRSPVGGKGAPTEVTLVPHGRTELRIGMFPRA